MRVFVNLQALASFDLDQLQQAFDQQVTIDDTDPGTAAVVQSGLVTLAASATSVQFGFGNVTNASLLLIIANQEVLAQLDSNTAPSIPVRPTPAATAAALTSSYQRIVQPGLVLWRGKVTSLYLSNPSSSIVAQAFVAIVGNAT
jgi:hypothetical protein